jgi:hypothetical protein
VETGGAAGATSTSTALISNVNPSAPGHAVQYTATVSPQPSGGTVAFTDGGSPISGCEAVAVGLGGQASCGVTYPAAGTHGIQASYGGNSLFEASSSGILNQIVQSGQEGGTPGGGGGGGSAVSPPPAAGVPPSTSPVKKILRCPKSKKRVVRNGKAKCVPKHPPRNKKH